MGYAHAAEIVPDDVAPITVPSEAPTGFEPRQIRALAACFCIYVLVNFDLSLFGYAVPGIIREFGIELGLIGTMLSVSYIMSVIGVLISSRLADRHGRAIVATFLLMASALFVGSLGLVNSIGMLFFLRAFGGGLTAGLTPVADAIVVENVPARWRGVAMGVLACGYPAGWFIASLFAAPLLESHGWRTVFLCAFGVAPLAIPFGWIMIRALRPLPGRPVPAAARQGKSAIGQMLEPGHRRITIGFALLAFSFGSAYAGSAYYFPTFFIEARGYAPSAAAALIGKSYGLAVIGYLGTALIGEFVATRRNTYIVWMMAGSAALLGLLWGPHGPTADLLFYAGTAIFVFSTSAILPVLVAELFPARIRATGVATCVSAPMMMGFVVFPTIVPRVVALVGWDWGFTIVIVPLLLLSGAGAAMLPNRRSGEKLVEDEDFAH